MLASDISEICSKYSGYGYHAGSDIPVRKATGAFASPEQVGELLGLKPHEVVRLRNSVRFSPFPKPSDRGRQVDF